MDTLVVLAIVAVGLVILFDYTNGFHDASNIIATVIASRAMTPIQAVCVVGLFEFLGPVLGGTAVANTIGKFVTLDDIDPTRAVAIILCGIVGAIVWNLGTWWFGIPSSSSHALVGGLCGAVIVAVGSDVLDLHLTAADLPRAAEALRGVGMGEAAVDQAEGRLRMPVHAGAADLMAAVRRLDEAGIVPVDVALRRPSLDDVFLSLTGHGAEEAAAAAPGGRRGRRGGA